MDTLISFVISYLPKAGGWADLIGKVPLLVGTAKELTAFIQQMTKILKAPNIPKTPEQENALDDFIESRKDQPHWQPES